MYVLSTSDTTAGANTQPHQPFTLTLHYATDKNEASASLIQPTASVLHDSYINSVKEADFLRSGTAKPIMSLSAADSKALWTSTQENDLSTFSRIHASLLPPTGQWRNVPLRIYLPSSFAGDGDQHFNEIRVLQRMFPPLVAAAGMQAAVLPQRTTFTAQPQTIGTALHSMLPSLFPSRRTPILARPILHGAPVPMAARLDELAGWCCYADGWLSVVIVLNA